MEIENHIDSLLVELKIPSGRSPLDTRDEADAIVDKHVVPAVELVVEQKGRDFDARIPQIEIDVGRVRLQDLREAIESALSEALEKYRPSIITPFPDSVESLRDYVGSGFAPWKEGESPFNPTLLVSEVLDHEPSSVLESLDAFSEKELGHLQMLLSEISLSEETGGAVAALSLSSLHHFRDTVWARLMQGFPETAAILSARLSRWRSLLAEPDRADITVSGPGRPTFVYVGIKQSDIPVGVFVETREYTETPDERDPDYIVLPEDPSRYFRKVRVGEVGEIDEKKGISASTSENVSEDGAEDIEGKKERLKQAAGGKEESEERRDSGQDRWDKALSQEKEQMPEGPGRTHSSFRYVAVRLSDIPVGAPVEAREYTENPTEKDPDYIVLPEDPSRYYWKVRVDEVGEIDEKKGISASTSENVSEDGAEDIEGKKERLKQAAGGKEESEERRDSGQDRWDKALSQEKEQMPEGPGRTHSSFRYVAVRLSDIPVGAPVEAREYTENPTEKDPDYIVTFDIPSRYFIKLRADEFDEKKETLESTEEKEQMTEGPGRTHSSFRYVAVRLSDIPVGAPVEAREYTENPTEKDPDYIVTFDIPSRYFWKVRVGEVGEVDEKTEISASTSENVSEDGAENIEGKKERLKQAAGGKEESEERRDSGQDRWDKALSQEKEQRTEERGRSRTSFRYVEINRFEVPVSYPLEIREPSDNPAPEDPEYVASPGSPVKYFKKTVVEKSIVSMGLDSAELPGRIADTPEIWGIQDFELDVTESRIPISDAGLVLLHPFLGRMMENLGLVKEGDFVSPLARIRAVHLLRDLTGSKEPHYNHHLLLEKILCALPVGYIIPSEWKPTSREKEEIKSLLEAVCDYWEPLSSSSTEALCGTFLRRPGSIERFEDSWIIRVEGHTVDILLDELPWELSIVYLPWLERPLAVEWQHE